MRNNEGYGTQFPFTRSRTTCSGNPEPKSVETSGLKTMRTVWSDECQDTDREDRGWRSGNVHDTEDGLYTSGAERLRMSGQSQAG